MTPPADSKSVLIVEPDDDTRALYALAFAGARWTADGAESGAIALAKALDRRPDLVVTELHLAGIDGFELIRILRRDPDTHQIPVIVVSADGVPASRDRAEAAGANLVLIKPCLAEALVTRATELLSSQVIVAARPPLDHVRATPGQPQPAQLCTVCGATLSYTHAHATRVGRRAEQWLHYTCPRGCGRFEYRERTRKLRKIS